MSQNKSILLICDDEEISKFLQEKLMLDMGIVLSIENTSKEGLETFKSGAFDIVIIKYGMPDMDTKGQIKALKKIDPDSVIIIFGEKEESETLEHIYKTGVYAFLVKPFNTDELYFLINKGSELHQSLITNSKLMQRLQEQNTALQRQNTLLAKRIEDSTKNVSRLYEDLRSTYLRTIKVLAQAIDARDHYTHSHSENVATIAVAIAEEMRLPVKEIELIREACELHDLGKIGIEDNILSKPSGLTEEERDEIKKHPLIGVRILEPLTFLNGVIELVKQHHERYDGLGYPEGRRGEDILLGARIINIADSYEAMRSARSYRKIPLSKEQAIEEIKRNSGKQFDPKIVEAFLKIANKLSW